MGDDFYSVLAWKNCAETLYQSLAIITVLITKEDPFIPSNWVLGLQDTGSKMSQIEAKYLRSLYEKILKKDKIENCSNSDDFAKERSGFNERFREFQIELNAILRKYRNSNGLLQRLLPV